MVVRRNRKYKMKDLDGENPALKVLKKHTIFYLVILRKKNLNPSANRKFMFHMHQS